MIIRPLDTHLEILKAYLSASFTNFKVKLGIRMDGMETTPATVAIMATFPDGVVRYAITTADAVMFLWKFGSIFPLLGENSLCLWCWGSRPGNSEGVGWSSDPSDVTAMHLNFSDHPDLEKIFLPKRSSRRTYVEP